MFGSSSIVVSIDVKKSITGRYVVYSQGGTKKSGYDLLEFSLKMEEMGCGEIIINSIDRDGSMNGYDLDLVKKISSAVSIPVVALGGAGEKIHFSLAIEAGASAVAAGSFFVFKGFHKAVLINFPTNEELNEMCRRT